MISTPQELEQLQSELRPLEAQKAELKEWAERRTQMLTWIGLGEPVRRSKGCHVTGGETVEDTRHLKIGRSVGDPEPH
jgi:hypothetical protein